MKNRSKRNYIITAFLALIIIVTLALNIFIMYKLTSEQTEQMGRMRIELVASDLQKRLTESSASLDRAGAKLENLFSDIDSYGYTGDGNNAIKDFLSSEKKSIIASSGRTCLNMFCITRKGDVLISDMETPQDYVVQDRIWYKGLMDIPTGDTYISSIYQDAFTNDMCFTISKILSDGESIIGIDYSMSEIQSYIEKMNASSYGEAMIVNRDGIIVGFSDTSLIGERLSEHPDIFNNYNNAYIQANYNDADSTHIKTSEGTVFCSRTENDWYIMLSIGNWSLHKNSYRQLIISSITLILIVLIISMLLIIGIKERYRAENALKAKEEFLSGLSGKFHNPLHKISELVSSEPFKNENLRDISDSIHNEISQLSDMMDNLFSYSSIMTTNIEEKSSRKSLHMTTKTQHKFRFWIVITFLITMLFTIFISSSLHLRWAKVKMTEEANKYSYQISSWVLEQKNILEMFTNYTENGYAFLADKDGQIINHPNTAYQAYDGKFVNIKNLAYNKIYKNPRGEIHAIKDYDGKIRECLIINDNVSNFNIVVMKDIWSMYGDVLRYIIIYFGLFSICIIGAITLINKMILWQKEANDNLRQAAKAANAADKAKSLFLAQMSHEIRTPINAVLGMNEMILRENKSPEIKEYSENIKSSGNTLLSLINDILDFSKIESGKMEIFPVKYDTVSVINDLVNMISIRASKKGLEFLIEIDEDIPAALYGDDIRIRQIITNLLTNAVKYTDRGSIHLSIQSTRLNAEQIMLHVKVSDTGIGIRDEDIHKLFSSFQRIDEQRNRSIEGTGLGIPITHNLLIMMGSKLNVSSTYGKGSTFSFDLVQGIKSSDTIGDFSSRRIQSLEDAETKYIYAPEADVLIVDDNAMNLKVASNLLKRNGFVPDTALSGQKCIEMVLAKHYDIIFMDHMMPGMDGIETLNNLIESHILPGDTAVVAMTANAVSGAKEIYLSQGFSAYLSKPIVIKQLEAVLEKYLPADKVSYKDIEIADKQPEPVKEDKAEPASPDDNSFCGRFSFLDTSTGLSYCDNDEELYLEIIKTYFENSKLDALIKYFDDEDWNNYHILIHSLKSTSLSIGATSLSEQAKALEFAAKDNNISYIKENHIKCIEEYKTLLENISKALDISD